LLGTGFIKVDRRAESVRTLLLPLLRRVDCDADWRTRIRCHVLLHPTQHKTHGTLIKIRIRSHSQTPFALHTRGIHSETPPADPARRPVGQPQTASSYNFRSRKRTLRCYPTPNPNAAYRRSDTLQNFTDICSDAALTGTSLSIAGFSPLAMSVPKQLSRKYNLFDFETQA
jgi:hypothetical protein